MSHLTTAQISASLDGALTGPNSERALEHLSSCVVCKEHRDRVATHDDALRRLFAFEPDHRALEDSARAAVERFARFKPPADAVQPTIQQDTTATPADPAQPLPPAREPSRGMRTIGVDGEAPAPLDVAPRLDTERTTPPKPEKGPGSLVESYDAFNDSAYAGPVARESPPMLGRPLPKPEANAEPQAPRKEYRHGGVRRDTPVPSERETSVRRAAERSQPEPRAEGFGVKREQAPAWSRLGFQPDPSSPGVYRETLTGAAISPPPLPGQRSGGKRSSSGRTALIATLAIVGGLAAVVLAMRIPTGVSVRFGGARDSTPSATPGTIEVRSATTAPPVDVAVPSSSSGTATTPEALRLCGQVVDVKGRPVDGVLLTVAATLAQTRTSADGHFCMEAPAGTQLVAVLDPRGTGTTSHQVRLSFVLGAPEARVVLP